MNITYNISDRSPAAYVVTIRVQRPPISERDQLSLGSPIREWARSLQTDGLSHCVESITVSSIPAETS